LPLTPAVEIVEKVTFQKPIFEKWDTNIEKRLVFCVPNNILAIFEPVVGDFCENFPSKGFFDSLVSPQRELSASFLCFVTLWRMNMATLILKEETPDRLVYVTNRESRKGNIITNWIKKDDSETTVILDLRYQQINRTKTNPKRPIEQVKINFSQVKNIILFSIDYSPMPVEQWPSVVAFTLLDESRFVFDSGRRDEMQPLAEKISRLIEITAEEKIVFTPKDFPK
jgi:hypothetical protein